MAPTYAGILGPLAFILVLVRGLIDGSSPDHILCTAIAGLLIFAALGYLAGQIADQVLRDAVRKQLHDELQNQQSLNKQN